MQNNIFNRVPPQKTYEIFNHLYQHPHHKKASYGPVATVHNINKATDNLNNDSTKITKWSFQWKMGEVDLY